MNKKYFLLFLITIIISTFSLIISSYSEEQIEDSVVSEILYKKLMIKELEEEINPEEEIAVIIEFKEEPMLSFIQKEKNKSTSAHAKKIEDIHVETIEKLKKDFKAKEIKRQYKYLMNGLATKIKTKDLEKIKKLPDVKKVWKDENLTILLQDSVPLINADDVWAEQNVSGFNITGESIIVAILDTGIAYDHSDLGNCTSAEFLAGNCEKVNYGYDFYNEDADPYDDHGHGTHCAGIVAANGGVKGVAPNATLLAYKVCSSSGSCPTSDIITAIENATLMGADVISMSLGTSTRGYADNVYQSSIDAAVANGTVVVIAAGNNGAYFSIGSPGTTPSAITVGSVDKSDIIALSSSKGFNLYSNGSIAGIKPDVVAPGVDIYSTVPTGSCSLCHSSGYKELDGTSMATPHISGVAALLKQAHPNWTVSQIKSAISNPAKESVYSHDYINKTPLVEGSGRVDAFQSYNITGVVISNNVFLGENMNISKNIWNSTKELNITNLKTTSITYNLSLNFSETGIEVNLSNTSITLAQDESALFNLTMQINNSEAVTGNYFGEIIVNSSLGDETLKIPFGVWVVLNPEGCPVDDTIITEDTTYSNITCYSFDFNKNSFIRIGASNIVLDCNGMTMDESIYSWYVVDSIGIYNSGYDNVTIKNCNLINYHYCYYLSGADDCLLLNNTASGYLVGEYKLKSGGCGFRVTSSDNNQFINNTARYFWGYAFAASISSESNYFYNNLVDKNNDGIVLFGNNNTANENNITSIVGDGIMFYGTYNNASNNIIDNCIYGIGFNGQLTSTINNKVYNTNLSGRSRTADIYGGMAGKNYFINSSYSNISFVKDTLQLVSQLYLTINVTDENNNPLQNANITVYENTTGSWILEWSELTDSNGLISIKPTTEFLENSTGKYYAYPTNITGSKSLYNTNSTTINMSDNQEIHLILPSGAGDVTSPTVTLTSPADQSTINLTNVTFECSMTEDIQLKNISLYGNWTGNWHLNQTKNITGVSNSTQFNITNLANETYIWNCYACDNSSNCALASSNYSFTINTSYTPPTGIPNVTIISPKNNSYFKIENVTLNFTVVDDADASLTCWYNLDGSIANIGNIANGTYNVTNLTSLSEAYHNISVICQDSNPQNGTSDTHLFYIDLTKPIVNSPEPADGDYVEGSIAETFSIDVNDETSLNTSSGRFFWRYPAGELFNEENMTCSQSSCSYDLDMSSIPEGKNLDYYFEIKDMAGNTGNNGTNVNPLTVTKSDSTSPTLTNIASSVTSSSATITWDTNEQANSTVYYGTTQATNSVSDSASLTTTHSITLNDLSSSTLYYYNVSSCDASRNCDTSSQYNFTTSAAQEDRDTTNGGGGGGGGGGDGRTYLVTDEQLSKGYTKEMSGGDRFKFTLENETHYVAVDSVTSTTVTINATSEVQQVILSKGEEEYFELTGDKYYDLSVKVNNINTTSSKTDITIKKIYEKVIATTTTVYGVTTTKVTTIPPTVTTVTKPYAPLGFELSTTQIGIIVSVIVIVALIIFIFVRVRTQE